jgi:hypothetical protein
MEFLFFEKIRNLYPNEWVLVGNPELRNPEIEQTIVSQLVGGIVICHSKDKMELAYKGRDLRKSFESITCVWTGIIPKNRKLWF